jgi:signal transduction histidine kinase/DNA-binding response OmpR family regulator
VKRILVVDDHATSRELLSVLLVPAGYRVVEAADGEEALRLAKGARPDLVITDLVMPRRDGGGLVRALRADPELASVPIVIYSASTELLEAARTAHAYGVAHVLTKPAEPSVLLGTVRALVHPPGGGRSASPPPPASHASAADLAAFQKLSARLSAIAESGLEFAQERSPDRLLSRLCQLAQHAVGCEYAVACVTGASAAFPARVASWRTEGAGAGALEIDVPASTPEWIGTALRTSHPHRALPAPGTRALDVPAGWPAANSGLAIPLRRSEATYGWLALVNRLGADGFRPDDEWMGSALASQFAVSFENVRLVETLRERAADLEREVRARQDAQSALVERANVGALAGAVGLAMTGAGTLREVLQRCTEAIVRHLDAAFARIWTLDAEKSLLVLQASAGLYTHLDGPHGRIPVGAMKIGRIAQERKPHLTNSVQTDPRVSDHAWAVREGMVAFAGHPLLVGGEVVGVVGLFARRPLGEATREGLAAIADSLALGVQRRRTEEAKAALEDQFRQAQKMEAVGRLAGGVAHDFNNLLTAILGYGELVREKLRPADPTRNQVEQIVQAGQRARLLTAQLLAFSRRQVVAPRPLDLNAVVRDMSTMLRRLLGEDVEVSLVLREGIGIVEMDTSQVEQVVLNLVVNSRDAMPSGGSLTIETKAVELDEVYASQHGDARPGPHVVLAVTDSGSGMDAETLAHLFEPFFTTKEQGKGTGLGLSTVYGIVRQAGGHVTVYSEVGKGSTFRVYLPRSTASPAAIAEAPPDRTEERGTETVLLVEDDAIVRGFVQDALRSHGYQVLAAANAGEAVLASEDPGQRVDLLVTDLVMPRIGGRELAARLRSQRPSIRVLFMSGYAGGAATVQGLVGEGDAFIEKPFTASALSRKVREVLREGGRRVTPGS